MSLNRYAIVTPVKNEERYFPKTIESVLNQEVKPQKWVIINDGSQDRTTEIINSIEKKHSWIKGLHLEGGKKRKPGGEALINIGIKELKLREYDFFVRMDGDLAFKKNYFENLFLKFDENPKLGIASGVCYVPEDDGFKEEKHPRFHTRGPLKTYRIECYFDIGGLKSDLGWDTVDEIKANMLGWQTRSFPELQIIHLRKTQTASGILQGMRNIGITDHYLCYHPLFMLLKCIRHMKNPPYILGGANMFAGFIASYAKRRKRIEEPAFIKYIRKQQFNKLVGRETIWK
jgi:glycosyltransferase involved in cell wall biosynthesis